MSDFSFGNPFSVQAAGLDRKQALLDALLKQSMTPKQGQMVSGHYVAPSALSVLANAFMASQYGGRQQALDDDRAKLAKEYATGLQTAAASYADTKAPGMGPGNPTLAATNAIGSQFPELQKLGLADLTNLGKAPAEEKFGHTPTKMLDEKTGKLIDVLIGDRGTVRPVAGFGAASKFETTSGGQLYDPYSGGKGPYVGPKFGPVTTAQPPGVEKPIPVQYDEQSGKAQFGPAGQNINIDNVGNKVSLNQAGEVLKTSRQGVLTAQESRKVSDRILTALDDPAVRTGFAANLATGLGAIGKLFGASDGEAVGKTQSLASDLAKNVLANASALKPLSNSDIDFLKQVVGGTVTLDAENLRDLAAIAKAASHNAALDNLEQYRSARTVEGVDEIAKLYPQPVWGTYTMDPSMFVDDGSDRFSYRGRNKKGPQLPLRQGPQPQSPAKQPDVIPFDVWLRNR